MEILSIIIITIIALFLVILVLNLIHSKNNSAKNNEKKVEEKKPEPIKEEKKVVPQTTKIKPNIELSSRPDFSDMIPEKKESNNPRKNKVEYEEINGGRLKVIKASDGLKTESELNGSAKIKTENKLAKEIKDLSPEMKTVVFGKVLDNID